MKLFTLVLSVVYSVNALACMGALSPQLNKNYSYAHDTNGIVLMYCKPYKANVLYKNEYVATFSFYTGVNHKRQFVSLIKLFDSDHNQHNYVVIEPGQTSSYRCNEKSVLVRKDQEPIISTANFIKVHDPITIRFVKADKRRNYLNDNFFSYFQLTNIGKDFTIEQLKNISCSNNALFCKPSTTNEQTEITFTPVRSLSDIAEEIYAMDSI